jgi:hypothetical protein
MCIIVDNDVAGKVFLYPDDKDFGSVHKRLFLPTKSPLRLVHGGQLTREYSGSSKIMSRLLALERAGRARQESEEELNRAERKVKATGLCVSNDFHILGLARVSGVRILLSHDTDLHTDFKNLAVLSPKGKVYQNASHSHVLPRQCV